jgi:hypothetical protein
LRSALPRQCWLQFQSVLVKINAKGGFAMTKTLLGTVHGRTIELSEDLGVAEGQEVEVQVTLVPQTTPSIAPMNEGLAKVYEILSERYDSGMTDLAQRHNEHQP